MRKNIRITREKYAHFSNFNLLSFVTVRRRRRRHRLRLCDYNHIRGDFFFSPPLSLSLRLSVSEFQHMNQHFSNILFGWQLWHIRFFSQQQNALNEFGKAVFLCLLFFVAEKSQRCVMDSYGRFDTWKQNQHNECAMSGSIVKRILLLYIKRI